MMIAAKVVAGIAIIAFLFLALLPLFFSTKD
jgi:hypothetical protein